MDTRVLEDLLLATGLGSKLQKRLVANALYGRGLTLSLLFRGSFELLCCQLWCAA